LNITKFNEKFNRVEGKIYTVEEVVTPLNGVYESELIHDNVTHNTINVYTGSKLTGNKINTYSISTPSLTPWKTVITIYSNEPKLYISYETIGDQVEAEDINNLQDSVNDTQKALNNEIARATNRENTIEKNLNAEINRAKAKENEIVTNLNNEVVRATKAEKVLTDNLSSEVTRAKGAEKVLTDNLNKEINRATNAESTISSNLNKEIERAKAKESSIENDLNTNRPNWNDAFNKRHTHSNKSIIDAITQVLINNWNAAFTHISDIVKHITATERANWNDANSKKHEHSNKSIIDTITSALINNWNSAFTHISDTVKHITSAERTLWNTVSNKLDKGGNAVSASKLQTARNIRISDNIIGDANFDGSANITINARLTRQDLTGKTIDLNTLNHSDGTFSRRYIETTEGGVANISNTPVKEPFILDVELIRYVSSSDYISKQTLTTAYAKKVYERYCTNGTWTSWGQVYTTTNKPTKADVGLGNVDNTSDANKPVSTAMQNALNGKSNTNHTHNYAASASVGGAANSAVKLQTARNINGVAFDGTRDITVYDSTKLPIKNITVATDFNTLTDNCLYYIKTPNCPNSPMGGSHGILFSSNPGTKYQIAIPDNNNAIYRRTGSGAAWGAWTNLVSKGAVGLGNVDNTSDLNKPISTATQNALNGKANSSHTHTKSQITDMPTKLSQFTNDAGFVKQSEIDTSQNHIHSNKPVLDKINQGSLDNWNNAYNDITKLQIGGRNLAQGTLKEYSTPVTSFNGGINKCVNLAKVLTDGLKVGDNVTVRLIYKYDNIVAATGKIAECWVQGSGNVTEWQSGSFHGSSHLKLSGSGEHEFLYSFTISENHLKNSYWSTNIRHDDVQSGSVKFKMFKVEKGNKPTDWTPAPEDINNALNNKVSKGMTWNQLEGI